MFSELLHSMYDLVLLLQRPLQKTLGISNFYRLVEVIQLATIFLIVVMHIKYVRQEYKLLSFP
jgi:hypothetical protein